VFNIAHGYLKLTIVFS